MTPRKIERINMDLAYDFQGRAHLEVTIERSKPPSSKTKTIPYMVTTPLRYVRVLRMFLDLTPDHLTPNGGE